MKSTTGVVTKKEYISYGAYFVGQNIFYFLIFSYMNIYFTDVGISAGNSSGTTNRNNIMNIKSGWGYNIIDISNNIPQDPPPEEGTTNSCDFSIDLSIPNQCTPYTNGGSVKDINDWNCIFSSSTSGNETISNYFLKYTDTSANCSVFCRDEFEYVYPKQGMTVLAGHRFTIGNDLLSYKFYLDGNTTKIQPAILGPVRVTVKRECAIKGTASNNCNTKLVLLQYMCNAYLYLLYNIIFLFLIIFDYF
jgi:hypothetical protein